VDASLIVRHALVFATLRRHHGQLAVETLQTSHTDPRLSRGSYRRKDLVGDSIGSEQIPPPELTLHPADVSLVDLKHADADITNICTRTVLGSVHALSRMIRSSRERHGLSAGREQAKPKISSLTCAVTVDLDLPSAERARKTSPVNKRKTVHQRS